MANIFEIAVNDQSVYYLGRLFGNMGTVLPGTGPALLGMMFRVFNTSLLALGAIVVSYTTVVGAIKTAQEGEFLGKWHSFWVPIRTVIGIAGLVPTSTGYCIIQVAMMWLIIQGVGAADTLWTTVIDYFESGGPVSTAGGFTTDLQTYQDVKNLFQGLVCQAAAHASYDKNPLDTPTSNCAPSTYSYYCSDPCHWNETFCQSSADLLNISGIQSINSSVSASAPSANIYNLGPNGSCGSLPIPSAAQIAQAQGNNNLAQVKIYQAQLSSYSSIIPTLGQIASELVSVDYQFNKFVQDTTNTVLPPAWLLSFCADNNINPCNSQNVKAKVNFSTPTSDSASNNNTPQALYWNYVIYPYAGTNFIRDSVNLYMGNILNAVYQSSNDNILTVTPNLNPAYEQSKANGWILAGAYYYTIAGLNNKAHESTNQPFNMTPPTTPKPPCADATCYNGVNNIQNTATHLSNYITNQQQQGGGEGRFGGSVSRGGGPLSSFTDFWASISDGILSGWMQALTSPGQSGSGGDIQGAQTNPLITLQAFGEGLLTTIQAVFGILIVLIFATELVSNVMNSVQPLGATMSSLVSFITIPIYFAMGVFFVLGGTLAVYMPLIPYIIFTFAALGWFIATIETMIAAPIVALGILHPEGQNEMWGKGEPAVMLILNIFLRPTLMIFGMLGGMLLSYVIVTLINSGFLGVARQVLPVAGIVEGILFMAIYTSLIITSLNKCFALIHLIPDQILRWLQGGTQASFGDTTGMEREVAGAAKDAGGTIKGAGESGARGIASGRAEARKQKPNANVTTNTDAKTTESTAGKNKDEDNATK